MPYSKRLANLSQPFCLIPPHPVAYHPSKLIAYKVYDTDPTARLFFIFALISLSLFVTPNQFPHLVFRPHHGAAATTI